MRTVLVLLLGAAVAVLLLFRARSATRVRTVQP
jgi:hypothetical protein